ncbi:protein Rae1 [Drosophila nasuta]|uniref:protein Rae1 n=1 Tax=Drosophila nasuta TaxID=42062 RepID=UPI00295E6541|nr:protein Rae1 [Drosophila nasuta]
MIHSIDFEVQLPPSDTISAMEFSPAPGNFLCASSWDQTVRIWKVNMNGTTTPKSYTKVNSPVLDISWSDDGSKIYLATGHEVHQWDLQSDQVTQIGAHNAGVSSCHWIKAPNYACLMTGSWDKTVKFWDPRNPLPMLKKDTPDRCYAADVFYPFAVIGCANNTIITYSLDKMPTDNRCFQSGLKQQMRCISLFRDNTASPAGFVVSGIEGRSSVHYLKGLNDTFKFDCHTSECNLGYVNIYAVNDVKRHPLNNTLATAGSDGIYVFWDMQWRNRLFDSLPKDQPLTKCCFNSDGRIFAYALGYDWSSGHVYYDANKQPQIFLHPCFS